MATAAPPSRASPEFANGGTVHSFHPATFAERGVAVPFTTPALVGVRMRARPTAGLELVVPNPNGARGIYVVGWSSVGEFCLPTVHDRCLADRLAAGFRRHGKLGPVEMQDAARAVALEGLAGREAAAAAAAAVRAETAAATAAAGFLLRCLLQPPAPAPGSQPAAPAPLASPAALPVRPPTDPPAGPDGHAHAAAASLAKEVGHMLVRCGLGCGPHPGRLTVLLGQLTAMAEQWRAWTADPTDPAARIAALTGSSMATTRLALFSVLARAQALTDSPLTLLQGWVAHRDQITATAARPGWLLDGWERIAARWMLAEDAAGQRAALTDFALMVPPLPHEAAAWADLKLDVEAPQGLRRTIRLQSSWRSAIATMDGVRLHERLLAGVS